VIFKIISFEKKYSRSGPRNIRYGLSRYHEVHLCTKHYRIQMSSSASSHIGFRLCVASMSVMSYKSIPVDSSIYYFCAVEPSHCIKTASSRYTSPFREHLQTNFGMLNVIVTLSSDLPPSLASRYKSNLLTTETYNMLVLLDNTIYYLLQAVFTSFYPFLHWTIASCCNKNFIMPWTEPSLIMTLSIPKSVWRCPLTIIINVFFTNQLKNIINIYLVLLP